MKINPFALKAAAVFLAGSISIPAEARVSYSVRVSTDGRITIKVDTNSMPTNGKIQQASLPLVIKDYQGNVLAPAKNYSITQWTGPLLPREIYEVRYITNVHRARYAQIVGPVTWAVQASGDKADGQSSEAEVLNSAVPTVVRGQGAVVPPPPSSATIQRCTAYSQTAVAQNRANRLRQCGLIGPRWSSIFNYHYRWCIGVPRETSDPETIARAIAMNRCNKP